MPEIDIKASCPKCGRNNPASAIFCGGCGMLASVESSAEPAAAIKAIKNEIHARKIPATPLSVDNAHVLPAQTKFENASLPTDSAARPQKKAARILARLPLRWRKKLAMALFVFLTSLIVVLLSGLAPAYQPSGTRWLDFRAFLARSFELTHPELDDIFVESLNIPADPKEIITSQQADSIESTLRSLLQKPELSIFPNPFFEAHGSKTKSAGRLASAEFSDIPVSHPFYTALEPLLELGIGIADKQNRAKPYEPVTWNDWQNSVDDLFKLLMIEPDLYVEVSSSRHGYMTNIDVRNYVEHLREKLYIKSSQQLVWSQEVFYPGRMEAFAVLASVIKELNANQ